MSMHKKLAAIGLAALVALSLAAPAVAKRPSKSSKQSKARQAVTKIHFHLDDHSVAPGELVTETVAVVTRDGREWVALADATLDVTLDGVAAGTLVTDAAGLATVSVSSLDLGEHVIKVAYAGTATNRKARRAQGFEVTDEVTTTPEDGAVTEGETGTGV